MLTRSTTCVRAQNSPHSSSCFNLLYSFSPLSHRFLNVCPEMVNVEVRPRLLTEGGLLVFLACRFCLRFILFFYCIITIRTGCHVETLGSVSQLEFRKLGNCSEPLKGFSMYGKNVFLAYSFPILKAWRVGAPLLVNEVIIL